MKFCTYILSFNLPSYIIHPDVDNPNKTKLTTAEKFPSTAILSTPKQTSKSLKINVPITSSPKLAPALYHPI
jgi:hypothetical protein